MAKFFLRTKEKKGIAKLYTRVSRPSFNVNWWVCTNIEVDIEKWLKSEKSKTAKIYYENTEEGKKVKRLCENVEKCIVDFFPQITKAQKGKIRALKLEKADLEKNIYEIAFNEIHAIKRKVEREKIREREKQLGNITRYYDYFLKGITDGTILHGGKEYTQSSIRVWADFGKYLKEYCRPSDTFDDITKIYANGFMAYLKRLGLMPETIKKQIVRFRKLCNEAAEDGINKNLVSVRVWKEPTIHDEAKRAAIVLYEDEINALYNIKLTGIREQVRDLWLLGYWTAQRVSDYTRLKRENFVCHNGTTLITFKQKKTGQSVCEPILDDRVLDICRKYDYDFPKCDKRAINRYIKDIMHTLSQSMPNLCSLVKTQLTLKEREKEEVFIKFNERIAGGEKLHGDEMKRYQEMKAYAEEHQSGNFLWKRNEEGNALKFRWEVVTAHTSRRSILTSLYDTGLLTPGQLKSISGHTSDKNLLIYLKRNQVGTALEVSERLKKAKEIKLAKEA